MFESKGIARLDMQHLITSAYQDRKLHKFGAAA
jgi:hypothetical protein